VFQRLVLDQGYYPDSLTTAPTEEDLIKDIQCGLDAGFNGARMHQKVFEPRYIYHADRMGYMVWGEYGSWSMNITELDAVAIFLPEWLESVRRDYNHPALITWCPFNESWDTTHHFPENQGKEQNNDVVRIIYEQTKLFDPTRPCVDASGNYHVKTDIYDIHDYQQDPAIFQENYDKLYTENDLVICKISDSGVGMDESTLSRIFEKFYQGDTSHKTRGHGIGLNIVQRIITLARGSIKVESKLGEGSTFTVTLPM